MDRGRNLRVAAFFTSSGWRLDWSGRNDEHSTARIITFAQTYSNDYMNFLMLGNISAVENVLSFSLSGSCSLIFIYLRNVISKRSVLR